MTEFSPLAAFLVGVAGSVHCLGMCGGIAGALRAACPAGSASLPYALAYNLGRISSYAIAGALTGWLGLIAQATLLKGLSLLTLLSGVMLLLMALYLGQWWRGLTKIEALGQHLWKHIQPLSKRFIPFKSPLSAVPYGAIWGWLPCGLVYSTLTWSLASGSALHGALVMICFGLGTLPALLAAGAGAGWLMNILRNRNTKTLVALLLLIYALFLIYRSISSIY